MKTAGASPGSCQESTLEDTKKYAENEIQNIQGLKYISYQERLEYLKIFSLGNK